MERIDVNGIYKHSPMNEAQINAEKNDDREIVINETQVTEAAPASSSDTDRTKFNPSYRCDTIYGKIRRNIATLETLALDGSQSTNDNLCGADLIGIDSTETYGVIQDATTVQGAIKELDTAVSEGGDLSNPVEELLVMNAGFQLKDAENTWTDPYDGQVYKIITIGTQTWLAENYRGHYQWSPNNNGANVPVYGGLYYGYGIDGNNVPDGWHLPSQAEWNTLINYVMNTYSLTSAEACAALCNNEEGWSDLTWQTNTTGMNLVAPGSFYQSQGTTGFNTTGYYLTTDAYFADSSFHICMTFSKNQIGSHEVKWSGGINQFNQYGASVRLVRDANASDAPQILKTVTTLKKGATDNTIPTSKAVWNECLRNVITSGGDLVVGNSGGTQVQRLGIGTEGQTLMVSSTGMPYWASMYLGTFTTANRPSSPINGSFGFDITIRNVVWFIDGVWVNAAGASV